MTSALLLLLAAGAMPPRLIITDDPAEPDRWRPVHDTVMGGLSEGHLHHEAGRFRLEIDTVTVY